MPDKLPKNFKCGIVSIVGRPNVGKSSLVNQILKEKIAIVSRIPQTTRNQIRGIYNDECGQIIFIDTPGLHLGTDQLDKLMNQTSTGSMEDCDCIIHLVDPTRRVGEEELNVVNKLKKIKAHVIVGLNKMDLKSADIAPYIELWEQAKGASIQEIENLTMITFSAKTGKNIDKLIDLVYEHLPKGPPLYERDTITDVPQKMVIADTIREKLFNSMKDEVPHSIGVFIEHMQPRKGNTTHIKALVYVERDTHKLIVVGKKGETLKKIGSQARKDLEELLGKKVFLEIHVKVQKRWRDNISLLQELGYSQQ